ncbi:MAG: type I restriction enzyme HsdR N-terminal domain-containing protein, partial [Candidatus Thorarchaeota archaeon]
MEYAPKLEDKRVVFVETKPFSLIMSQNDSEEAISYGRVEDVEWAVLTNGKYMKVFDTEQGKSESECLVTEIDLRKLPEKAEYVNLLSRESILAGEIEEAPARLAATRKAIHELKDCREEIAEKFKEDLLEITGSEVENRVAKISSQLADQAIQLFEKSAKTSRSQEVQEIQLAPREDLANKANGDAVGCTSRIG